MIGDHVSGVQRVSEFGAVTGAVIAGVSLANAALIVTIMAGIGSLSLVGLRWYVWLRYGRERP